ncbi:uncharacterized protein (TIGR04255 family) [Bradyrhizobium elkanii]|uniref:Uncharacterized protein (TIGR04255 family) n=1 Tax=Bradyrhizobium elkanii TaxID=29448 RepID=A0A8I1YCH8_BRAEL|nr:uncharacterized protein (TIGR04255 family) [Bradyrhizobium elkanii]
MASPHPTYPNPTIVQVACEITFASQSDVRLTAGLLFPSFASEFPEIAPIAGGTIQLVMGQPSFAPEAPPQQPPAAAFRFSTESDARFVQLSKNNFIYQTHEAYPGWADYRAKLLELWAKSSVLLAPTAIVKLGLRYINRIPKTGQHKALVDWLQTTPDVPGALLTSKEHFLGRVESSPAPSHLRLVTVANAVPTPDAPEGAIIFDIDRIATEQLPVSAAAISEKLDVLHEDIWNSFNTASSPLLKAYLSGSIR